MCTSKSSACAVALPGTDHAAPCAWSRSGCSCRTPGSISFTARTISALGLRVPRRKPAEAARPASAEAVTRRGRTPSCTESATGRHLHPGHPRRQGVAADRRPGRHVLRGTNPTNDRVPLQSPANSGTLAPTGNLGVNAGPNAGFGIYFSHRTRTNHGFAAFSVNGAYRFYDINILTGQAMGVGAFPKAHQVTGVALPLNKS
ncbi:DUF4394 domain-containing protein [Streptomyces pakalii]|nr:DUF4394 domain-containing protein [Streptomyces pakalii]